MGMWPSSVSGNSISPSDVPYGSNTAKKNPLSVFCAFWHRISYCNIAINDIVGISTYSIYKQHARLPRLPQFGCVVASLLQVRCEKQSVQRNIIFLFTHMHILCFKTSQIILRNLSKHYDTAGLEFQECIVNSSYLSSVISHLICSTILMKSNLKNAQLAAAINYCTCSYKILYVRRQNHGYIIHT